MLIQSKRHDPFLSFSKRCSSETYDELELYDLLKPEKMTEAETQRVVKAAVEEVLDTEIPESYDRTVFRQKCDSVFDTMLDYAIHGVKFAA